ncbi:ATP-binding protein (plasmid) [Streptomyces canus]|uniref:AlbA family DNA-binding domain-containing protein n=1 Tax=Streptomyces canus TaxID=58343 RepID=UPI002F9133CF
MPADSMAELISLLSVKSPYAILGTPESEWVDFKSVSPKGPYDLSTDKGKFEFAKDVTAFANAGGGLIVCGFKAKKRQSELYEVAEKVTPFEKKLVNTDSYKDVLTEYVRPLLGVKFLWFDHPADDPEAAGHYFVIEVSALPDSERWALVTRGLSENGQFVKGSWTVPIRNGDSTAYLAPDEVYRLMNDGLRTRYAPAPAAAAPEPAADRAKAREDLRATLGMEETPVLFFQSAPDQPHGLLPGMYADDGLRHRLSHQDTLRPSGFNWSLAHKRPESREGGFLLSGAPRRGLLIEADGAVTAAAAATPDMLGWGMEHYNDGSGPRSRRISVFALTEMTLEYFRLVDQYVLPLTDGAWTHRVVASDFGRPPARTLGPGDDPDFPFQGSPQPATGNNWNYAWKALGDPERDAYEALRHIYALFGLDISANPFTDIDRISTAKLLEKR